MKWQTHSLWKPTRVVPGTKTTQSIKQQKHWCGCRPWVLCSCSSTWAAQRAPAGKCRLPPWPSPKMQQETPEKNQPEIHPPWLWYHHSPSSPGPLRALASLSPWSPFSRHPLGTEQTPCRNRSRHRLALQTLLPQGNPAGFDALRAWGREATAPGKGSSRGDKHSLPKFPCTGEGERSESRDGPVWEMEKIQNSQKAVRKETSGWRRARMLKMQGLLARKFFKGLCNKGNFSFQIFRFFLYIQDEGQHSGAATKQETQLCKWYLMYSKHGKKNEQDEKWACRKTPTSHVLCSLRDFRERIEIP